MKIMYSVIKHSDIQKYLTTHSQFVLTQLLDSINNQRTLGGKKQNKYIVINTDEPYIDEIIEIMKKHGHWGEGK